MTTPRAPKWEDHTFVGWYTDTTYANEWDFATDTVTEDTVLYAKWSTSLFAELNDLIEEAEQMSAEDYAPEDFADFAAALAAAKEVQANPEADQQTINNATAALQAAYDELLTKEPITPPIEGEALAAYDYSICIPLTSPKGMSHTTVIPACDALAITWYHGQPEPRDRAYTALGDALQAQQLTPVGPLRVFGIIHQYMGADISAELNVIRITQPIRT